MLDKFCI